MITLLAPISNDVLFSPPPRTVTAVGAMCGYDLELPATDMRFDEYGSSGAQLNVTVNYAGTPEAVEQNFLVSDDEQPIDVADGECYVRQGSTGVECRKGSLAFSIRSDFRHLILSPDAEDRTWTNRYQVRGEITTITASSSDDLVGFQRNQDFRRDHLDAELAKTVLAKF
jgi:hypothetical protein